MISDEAKRLEFSFLLCSHIAMFTPTRYTNTYYAIIKRAHLEGRSRTDATAYENHHIIPRSLGGTNDQSNLVLLTLKEHYVCHRLLVKMTTGADRFKMYSALMFMQSKHTHIGCTYYSPSKYQRDRIACKVSGRDHPCFGKPVSQTRIDRMKTLRGVAALRYGKYHSDETRRKMSAAHKGRIDGPLNPMYGRDFSPEHRRKIGDAVRGEKNGCYGIGCVDAEGQRYAGERHGMYGKKHSEETKAKIRQSVYGKQVGVLNHQFGRVRTSEERQAARERIKGRRWINDGRAQRLVTQDEADSLVGTQWSYGRLVKGA